MSIDNFHDYMAERADSVKRFDVPMVMWVCPEPNCDYYESHCGLSEERFCPVYKVGDRVVHDDPLTNGPRLIPLEVVPRH